ncbi:hypothetical protein EDD86DRAFT_265815 [Gorgonomyces haynaldii]|nr:hypothetical protein EDD86DRAFT_265815 [Gorgonomyces haynaldii]
MFFALLFNSVTCESDRILSESPVFDISFHCHASINNDTCFAASSVLSTIGRHFEVFRIQKPINVNFTLKPFCTSLPCTDTTIGRAYSAANHIVHQKGRYFTFPQSLVKQLNVEIQTQWAPVDIVAEFNSNVPWSFGNESNTTFVDFELVVIHELIHGMGFSSNLLHYSQIIPTAQKNYLAPVPFEEPNGNYSYLSPLTVFDSHLVSEKTVFADLGQDLESFKTNQSVNFQDFVQQFEKSKHLKAANTLYNAATSGKLFFQTESGRTIKLYAGPVFLSGSSIDHLDTTAISTSNFVMIPTVIKNQTTSSIQSHVDANGPIGNDVMEVLTTIGWPRITDIKIEPVHVVQGYSAISSGWKLEPIFILLAIALCY